MTRPDVANVYELVFVSPIFFWHIRFANDLENLILKTHIYLSLPIALPIVYFIRNPQHLTTAMTILHSG